MLVALFAAILNLKVSFSPFHISVERSYVILGIVLIFAGVMFLRYDSYHIGFDAAHKAAISAIEDIIK